MTKKEDTVRLTCTVSRRLHQMFRAKLERVGRANEVDAALLYLIRRFVHSEPRRLVGFSGNGRAAKRQ